MRAFQKAIKNLKFDTPLLFGMKTDTFMNKLASGFRQRVYLELTRIHRNQAKLPYPFLDKSRAHAAIQNTLACFSDNYSDCRRKSLVCCAHLPFHSPKHLPYGRYLALSENDMTKLRKVLDRYFGMENLHKIERMLNTNKSESVHHRVSTYVPKCTTYTRNFNGLCHSALHSQTFGTGKSCILIAKMLKIKNSRKNPMHYHMSKRDQKSVYDSKRQTTLQFKRNRYLNKKKKINRKLQKDSALNNPEVSEHHNYAINPYQ